MFDPNATTPGGAATSGQADPRGDGAASGHTTGDASGSSPSPHAAATDELPPVPASASPYPTQQQPAAASPAKRNRLAIVFGSLALVLLLAAGAVTALYVVHRGEANKTSNDQQAQIASLQDQLEQTEDDLTDTKSELSRAANRMVLACGVSV